MFAGECDMYTTGSQGKSRYRIRWIEHVCPTSKQTYIGKRKRERYNILSHSFFTKKWFALEVWSKRNHAKKKKKKNSTDYNDNHKSAQQFCSYGKTMDEWNTPHPGHVIEAMKDWRSHNTALILKINEHINTRTEKENTVAQRTKFKMQANANF